MRVDYNHMVPLRNKFPPKNNKATSSNTIQQSSPPGDINWPFKGMERLKTILMSLTKSMVLERSKGRFSQVIALLCFPHFDAPRATLMTEAEQQGSIATGECSCTEKNAGQAEASGMKILTQFCFVFFFLAGDFRITGEQLRSTKPSKVSWSFAWTGRPPTICCSVIHFTKPILKSPVR